MKWNIEVTSSKALAFLIVGLSFGYTFWTKDPTVCITGISASTLLIGVKTGVAGIVKIKKK